MMERPTVTLHYSELIKAARETFLRADPDRPLPSARVLCQCVKTLRSGCVLVVWANPQKP